MEMLLEALLVMKENLTFPPTEGNKPDNSSESQLTLSLDQSFVPQSR